MIQTIHCGFCGREARDFRLSRNESAGVDLSAPSDLSWYIPEAWAQVVGIAPGLPELIGLLGAAHQEQADASRSQATLVPLQSLLSDGLELIKPIQVLLQPEGEQWLASFLDAQLFASGETREQVFESLRDELEFLFEYFEAQAANLGEHPRRQLAVLRQFIKFRN